MTDIQCRGFLFRTFSVATLVLCWSCSAKCDIIANWHFEETQPIGDGTVLNSAFIADVGTGVLTRGHTGNAFLQTASGNGSAFGFSSEHWEIGDYYQFTVSTAGMENLLFSWEQTGNNSGPSTFELQYNVGDGFVTVMVFTLTSDDWESNPASYQSVSYREFDFSSIVEINNVDEVVFRLVDVSNDAISGFGVGPVGDSTIDNIMITGEAITSMPEPSSAILTGTAFISLVVRRRRRLADAGQSRQNS